MDQQKHSVMMANHVRQLNEKAKMGRVFITVELFKQEVEIVVRHTHFKTKK